MSKMPKYCHPIGVTCVETGERYASITELSYRLGVSSELARRIATTGGPFKGHHYVRDDGKTLSGDVGQDISEDFSPNMIRDFLTSNGAKGVVDINTLSAILGCVLPRTIREYVRSGELRPMNNPCGRQCYVFALADVVSWLMRYPHYLAQQQKRKTTVQGAAVSCDGRAQVIVTGDLSISVAGCSRPLYSFVS